MSLTSQGSLQRSLPVAIRCLPGWVEECVEAVRLCLKYRVRCPSENRGNVKSSLASFAYRVTVLDERESCSIEMLSVAAYTERAKMDFAAWVGMMASVFRCDICSAVFKNRRQAHYSDVDDAFCSGTLEISEVESDELILASIARRKTRSRRDRAKLAVKRKQTTPPRVAERCKECEALGTLCARCRHKKMKRDWMRAKRTQIKEQRRVAAASVASLFGASSA